MKSLVILVVIFAVPSAFARTEKVYPRVAGIPVNNLCLNSEGSFNATVNTCQDYSVTEAGPQCFGPTTNVVTIPRVQHVCDNYSTGEDFPACLSTHLEQVPLEHTVLVTETENSYNVDEGGPTNYSRVLSSEQFIIPNCQ